MFSFFKKKKTVTEKRSPSQESPIFPKGELARQDLPYEPWPTESPTPLIGLMASSGYAAVQAAYLIRAAAILKESEGFDEQEFQVPLASNPRVVIPCLGKHGRDIWIIFSHSGQWTKEAINSFILWNNHIRADEHTKFGKILVVTDHEPDYLRSIMNERNGVWFKLIAGRAVN